MLRKKKMDGLQQLYANAEFDAEQIWFQLEDQIGYCERRIKKLINKLHKKEQINLLDPGLEEALEDLLEENNEMKQDSVDDDELDELQNEADDLIGDEGEGQEFGVELKGDEDVELQDDELNKRSKKRQKLDFEDDFMNIDEMSKFLEHAEEAYEKGQEGIEDDLEKALNEEIMKMGGGQKDADEGAVNEDDLEMEEGEDDEDNTYHDAFFGRQKIRNFNMDRYGEGVNRIQLGGRKQVRFSQDDSNDPIENGYSVQKFSQRQKVGDDDEDEEEEGDDYSSDEVEVDPKATLQEQQQQQLQKQIKKLEKQAIGEKDWYMKGEVMAYQRPKDSVFEVDLDYDRTRKPPPEPTQEKGLDLEDLIKNRIGEGKFDDVIRIVPMPPKKQRKELILDDTQNQEGLASLYEQDYVRTATGNVTKDKQAPVREQIRQLYSQIAYELDQLSHFSFAPMPVIEELSIKANVPAIAMEEVGANAVSKNVSMKLPEELFKSKTKDGDVKADTELSKEDRKKRRRQAKTQFQAKQKKEMEQKGQLPQNLGGWAMLAGRKSMLKTAPQKKDKTKYNSLQVFKQLETEKSKKINNK
eukprot:TRINITY_DN16548_c0_g1_i4.p1 TRINITY_DN16548_c0_g1~~TRINITY_DN16548_c0_g1_i4.p1  ORF type:complete len:582 (+),score=151.18 TRINITY_DN16548_c0_g1_i4:159-1904(+)